MVEREARRVVVMRGGGSTQGGSDEGTLTTGPANLCRLRKGSSMSVSSSPKFSPGRDAGTVAACSSWATGAAACMLPKAVAGRETGITDACGGRGGGEQQHGVEKNEGMQM